MVDNYIVLKSNPGNLADKPFSAFFVADYADLEKRLAEGQLQEGDIIYCISDARKFEIATQLPLKIKECEQK